MAALYKGFSTFEYDRARNFRMTDVELVKMDLLNHIFTRRGERINMPRFGTQIPDMIGEPLDEDTVGILRDELEAVIEYDPRVEKMSMEVIPMTQQHVVIIHCLLRYIELDTVDEFSLNLEFQSA